MSNLAFEVDEVEYDLMDALDRGTLCIRQMFNVLDDDTLTDTQWHYVDDGTPMSEHSWLVHSIPVSEGTINMWPHVYCGAC
jgi:hypothetical protein